MAIFAVFRPLSCARPMALYVCDLDLTRMRSQNRTDCPSSREGAVAVPLYTNERKILGAENKKYFRPQLFLYLEK